MEELKRCPKCGIEYGSWVRYCFRCFEPLVGGEDKRTDRGRYSWITRPDVSVRRDGR